MKINFPNKTAQEIVTECNNKLGNGKLLWNTDWYEKENFYTTEKCRPRTMDVSDEITHFDKDWNECKELGEKEGMEMLNFAETLWFLLEYWKEHKAYPTDALKWSWTSSRSSDGGLVCVGGCDAEGVGVGRDGPGVSDSHLGVRFFAVLPPDALRVGQTRKGALGSLEHESLEESIKKVKEAGYKIFKEI